VGSLRERPLLPYLLGQSLTLFAGLLALAGLSLVDLYFIGNLGGKALTAVSFTTPVFMVGVSFLLSLSTGLTAVLSPALGRQDASATQSIALTGWWLSLGCGLLLGLVGVSLHRFLFGLMGASEAQMPDLWAYMQPIYAAMPVVGALMAWLSVRRSHGDHRYPALVMGSIVLLNVLLDPLLMFTAGLGLRGASLATLLALLGGAGLAAWGVKGQFPFGQLWRLRRVGGPALRAILHVALPAAGSRTLLPLSNSVIVGLLASFGPAVVAAFGTGYRIDLVVQMYLVALSSVLAPWVGQCYGAGDGVRLRRALRWASLIALGYGLAMAGLLFGWRAQLGALFTDEAPIQAAVARYYRWVPWAYAFNGLTMLFTGSLNVLRAPWLAALVGAVHLLVFYLPLATWGRAQAELDWVWAAWPLSNVLAAGLAGALLYRQMNRGAAPLR
jgi:putative MATE family efflux protein